MPWRLPGGGGINTPTLDILAIDGIMVIKTILVADMILSNFDITGEEVIVPTKGLPQEVEGKKTKRNKG